MAYAEAVKILRKKMLLTQMEMAEELDVAFISINRWEKGHCEPTMKAKRKLAPLFDKYSIEVLNKYHIFQENILNNYIHQFFVNESLGSKLNLEDEEIKRQYRNSFDWFGFGLDNDIEPEIKIPERGSI